MSVILVSQETTTRKSAQESWDGATSRSEEDRADKEEVGSHDAITIAQLKARVEQQSSLIGMLKQRNDETFREVKPYSQDTMLSQVITQFRKGI